MRDQEIVTKLINDTLRAIHLGVPEHEIPLKGSTWQEQAADLAHCIQTGQTSKITALIQGIKKLYEDEPVSRSTIEEGKISAIECSVRNSITGVLKMLQAIDSKKQQKKIQYVAEDLIEDYIAPAIKVINHLPITVTGYQAVEIAGSKEKLQELISKKAGFQVWVSLKEPPQDRILDEKVEQFGVATWMHTTLLPIVVLQKGPTL